MVGLVYFATVDRGRVNARLVIHCAIVFVVYGKIIVGYVNSAHNYVHTHTHKAIFQI